jgi:hypothetical protein
MGDLQQDLFSKIKTLNETVWEHRASRPVVEDWLSNFDAAGNDRLQALFLLAHFMYFGSTSTVTDLS